MQYDEQLRLINESSTRPERILHLISSKHFDVQVRVAKSIVDYGNHLYDDVLLKWLQYHSEENLGHDMFYTAMKISDALSPPCKEEFLR